MASAPPTEGKVFVDTKTWAKPWPKGGLDGVKCDAQGNLFATVSGGFAVMAPDGTLLGWFKTGDRTANLCFGGDDGQTLFVCVNHRVGRVRLTEPLVRVMRGRAFELADEVTDQDGGLDKRGSRRLPPPEPAVNGGPEPLRGKPPEGG